jgi:hypothetical protein
MSQMLNVHKKAIEERVLYLMVALPRANPSCTYATSVRRNIKYVII